MKNDAEASAAILNMDFNKIIEQSPIAFYTCDNRGLITYYNSAAVLLWGRKPNLGKDFWCGAYEIHYPDGTPMSLEEHPAVKAIKTGGFTEKVEVRISRPDGSYKNLIVFPQLQLDENKELAGAAFTLIETSQKETEHIRQATLSTIVESSDDAIVSKDLNGIITSWNAGAKRIFGYSEVEIVGKSITTIIPKNRLHEEEEILKNIRSGRRVDHMETIRIDKWGKKIPISVTVSPIKNALGEVVGASKVARNISDKLRGEEKQAMLSAIVESSDDAIISKNLNGIIMSWNRGAEKIFGYSEDEAVGRSIKMLIPEERLSEEDVILNKIRKGEKVDHFETVRRHKSGKRISISITVSPIKDSRGNIIGASKVARDITLQVQSQEALERYTHNLEILNSIGKSISENLDYKDILQRVTDITTKLSGAAFGAFFYNSMEEDKNNFKLFTISGAPVNAVEDLDLSPNNSMFLPTFKNKQVIRMNNLHHHDLGEENFSLRKFLKVPFEVISYMAIPVVAKSGEVMGALIYGHPEEGKFKVEHEQLVINIAAQAAISLDNSRLFEQVKSLSDKKDEFIALASHELKTPLTTIKGYLQVLSKHELDKTKGMFVNRALYQVEKLNTLVENILNMSRIEKGRLEFNLEVFDLRKMLQDTVDTFQWSAETHKVIASLGEIRAYIQGDKQRIEQAVLNFLTNAIKYSPRADTVYLNLSISNEEVRVSVKDEGIGLTPGQQEQLFTRFYRAEDTKGINGLGLGLYLTKQIIDRHNGSIDVSSVYGKGSEFSFTLPLIKKEIENRKAVLRSSS